MAFEGAELEEYTEMFEAFDLDNDGCITHNELKTALNRLGYKLNDDQIKELIDDADDDGDGTISKSEFMRVMSGQPKPDKQKAYMRKVFRAFDIDGSGFITIDNMRQDSGIEIDEDILKAIIAEVDTDGDGTISFEEFVAMVEDGRGF